MSDGSPSGGSLAGGPALDVAARIVAEVDAIMRAAIVEARRILPTLPEYDIQGDASGKRLIVPVHALATGMLKHLEDSYLRANPDKELP